MKRMLSYRRSSPGSPLSISRSGRTTATSTSLSTSTTSLLDRSSNTAAEVSLTPAEIDELARAFQSSIDVQNRKCKQTRQKYKNVFLGSEAVDVIQQLTRVETRQEALQVGRQIQSLFECVNAPRVQKLQDDARLFYKFTTTIRPVKPKEYKNLDEKMRVFQRGVEVKDREYYVTTYKQCFVGKQAVDLMMHHKMGKTRAECVEIGRLFQTRYRLFVPVGFVVDFEDDAYKFYRLLLPQKEKEKAPTFFQEIQPARWLILSSLIPALIAYYYLY